MKHIQTFENFEINESNIWVQGGVLLIKGSVQNGKHRLFATNIRNLIQLDRFKVDNTKGQPAKMAILGDDFWRLVIEDGRIVPKRISWRNDATLTKMLKFKNQSISVVLNNNKTPRHWETLQFNNVYTMINKIGTYLQTIENIEW